MSKFIDLYAGIGGFRYGFEKQGHKCVWSCEIDEYARQVYRRHWEEPEAKDIRDVQPENIPEHDILCAGFPCQSFSLAGNREGFEDSRGTLFHEICRIARVRKPAWLCLENVQGLLSTQDRKAFRVVLESLDDIGYDVTWQVLNSKNFGVPQNRPRVFIIGGLRTEGKRPFKILPVGGNGGKLNREDKGTQEELNYIGSVESNPRLEKDKKKSRGHHEGDRVYSSKGISPTITPNKGRKAGNSQLIGVPQGITLANFSRYEEFNRNPIQSEGLSWALNSAGDQGVLIHESYPDFRIYNKKSPSIPTAKGGRHLPFVVQDNWPDKVREYEEIVPSITAHETGGWEDIKIKEKMTIRKLMPVECERLQGFPDGWTEYGVDKEGNEVEISDTQRYKLIGNAVTTNVVEFLAGRFKEVES